MEFNPQIMAKLSVGPQPISEIDALEGAAETLKAMNEAGMKVAINGNFYVMTTAMPENMESEKGEEDPQQPGPVNSQEGPPDDTASGVAAPPPAHPGPAESPRQEAPTEEPGEEIPIPGLEGDQIRMIVGSDIKLRSRKGQLPKLEIIPFCIAGAHRAQELSSLLKPGTVLLMAIRIGTEQEGRDLMGIMDPGRPEGPAVDKPGEAAGQEQQPAGEIPPPAPPAQGPPNIPGQPPAGAPAEPQGDAPPAQETDADAGAPPELPAQPAEKIKEEIKEQGLSPRVQAGMTDLMG